MFKVVLHPYEGKQIALKLECREPSGCKHPECTCGPLRPLHEPPKAPKK